MVKRCPTCHKTFIDPNLSFCVDDGTPLAPVELDDETTVVSASSAANRASDPPPYQPPGSYIPPGGQSKRRAWPWILGLVVIVLLLLVGLVVAAAFLFPKLNSSSRTDPNTNVERRTNDNSNTNSSPIETNTNANVDENAPVPTDEQQVLSDLTDLENEWTAANINADKKKLDRILADDYVGQSADGSLQGKAEYLKTIERDTTIQKWEFDELTVSLKGDRAALSGIIRLQAQGQEVTYRFTDKFVWRDGRWQAVASEVSRIE